MKKTYIDHKIFLIIMLLSLAVKLVLWGYAAINAPSAKFMPDTPTYLEPGVNLVEKGLFATFDDKGAIRYETMRTPGYPLFTAFLNKILGLSFDAIIIVQILLITFTGYVVYKAAYQLDRKIAPLASFIFLLDQPVTISTLMLLSEALYTVFMALFIYLFLRYLRGYNIVPLVLSVLMLAIATYIRPISYWLGLCVAAGLFYILFSINIKKAATHALIFLLLFYASLGVWHYRNYIRTGNADFTSIDNMNVADKGLMHKYARGNTLKKRKMSPIVYYARRSAEYALEFFTLPGTLKYLESLPIKVASKIWGYAWVFFWLAGLFFARFNRWEYRFLLATILYFMLVSVLVISSYVSSRFRAPVMPLISILSASGWIRIASNLAKYRKPH